MTPERLALISFFAQLKTETRAAIVEAGQLRDHAPGDPILARNEETQHFVFLIEGQWTARRFVVGTADPLIWTDTKPGAWISGIAALDAIAQSDVFADKQTRTLAVPREAFLKLLPTDRALAMAILRDIHLWSERIDVHCALIAARGIG